MSKDVHPQADDAEGSSVEFTITDAAEVVHRISGLLAAVQTHDQEAGHFFEPAGEVSYTRVRERVGSAFGAGVVEEIECNIDPVQTMFAFAHERGLIELGQLTQASDTYYGFWHSDTFGVSFAAVAERDQPRVRRHAHPLAGRTLMLGHGDTRLRVKVIDWFQNVRGHGLGAETEPSYHEAISEYLDRHAGPTAHEVLCLRPDGRPLVLDSVELLDANQVRTGVDLATGRAAHAGSTMHVFKLVLDRRPTDAELKRLDQTCLGDATIGVERHLPIAEFDRAAVSLAEAIATAVRDVESVGLKVLRVLDNDLLTLADIARQDRPES